jgi:RNA polymerase sigma-70 factor, ECF subfamily
LSAGDIELVTALRSGDETAFATLVETYHAKMVRMALTLVGDVTVAEEVTQDAWLGVLRGLARFEGRASLQTWIFAILTNCARTRAKRERRTIAFSVLLGDDEDDEPVVDPDRFQSEGQWQGHWRRFPMSWDELPEQHLLAQETLALAQQAIEALPPNQKLVIQLRDIEGLTAAEVCNILQVSESNERVLLHRARSKVHRVLAQYFGEE